MAVFFLVLGLFGTIQSLTFGYWESMVLPLAISIIIFILASVEVVRELQWGNKGEADAAKATAKDSESKAENRRLGLISAWAAGFCMAIYLLGFYIAIPLFAFAYLKWQRRGWLPAVIFAIALLAFIYIVFNIGLKVPLYKGLIFGAH
ncbi:tripartite tricarboxylate transporter TctB family protein [Chloroflexota bacterium]